ncbi:hypothetical protein FOF52_03365 [Thermobifida alba]|uniref:Uncharacterized protein n=1 Tax=Thermobifida alba TaxID=53522 RepID=A0ABY4KXF7_THEAE|nr:hypothetical protein FOF52_03365 [Thermobifida alba]
MRLPAGEARACWPGQNQTLCGLALHRSRLWRFPHVPWPDVFPESGGAADEVRRLRPKCRAAAGGKRSARRGHGWTRTFPRP